MTNALRVSLVWLFLACLWSGLVHAQAPRLEFKGLVLGEATEAQVRDLYAGSSISAFEAEMLVFQDRSREGDGFALPGGYRTNPIIFEWLHPTDVGRAKTLGAVRFPLGLSAFPAMRDALTLKYGEPTKREPRTLRTGGGASVETYALVWTLPDGVIRLNERSGKINESGIEFYVPAILEQRERQRKKTAEDGVKAL